MKWLNTLILFLACVFGAISQDTLHIYYMNADSIDHTFFVTKSYTKTTYKTCIDKVFATKGVKPEMIMIQRKKLSAQQLAIKSRLLKN